MCIRDRDYHFTILLGNPEKAMLQLNKGYSGDGGIPGYLMLSLLPNDYTLPRVQAALAHECNHNVRFQMCIRDSPRIYITSFRYKNQFYILSNKKIDL